MFVPLTLKEAEQLPQGTPCIVVPFREQIEQKRGEHLKKFVTHIKRYHPDWPVIIAEQSDDGNKFNRGALCNAGARIAAKNGFEYVVFQDVDLIPLSLIVPYYTAFPQKPIHIGKAWTGKYQHERFLGGVLSMSIKDLKETNGFPNMFWGWGGEDDALRNRIFSKDIDIYQPTMRGKGFTEIAHASASEKKETLNVTKRRDVDSDTGRHGFRDIKYKVLADTDLAPNIKKITLELYKI